MGFSHRWPGRALECFLVSTSYIAKGTPVHVRRLTMLRNAVTIEA